MSARTASADGVDYTVNGAFAAIDGFSSTSLSNPGDSFTLTFSVDPALLGPGPIGGNAAGPIAVTFDYTDFLGSTINFSLTGQAGTATFYTSAGLGLFDIEFIAPGGDDFLLQLLGPDPGFVDGTPPALNTGTFVITPGPTTGPDTGTGSLFGDFNTGNADSVSGTVTAVSSTAVPEPSSLLLLGSGFLALGTFARKRLLGRIS
ncbi:MAG: PEP-CTERM sorting domain-containing protein [Candidatus Acidiferrales bacterium]